MPGKLLLFIIYRIFQLSGILSLILWSLVYFGVLKHWGWVILPFIPFSVCLLILVAFFFYASYLLYSEGDSIKTILKGWFEVFIGKKAL